MRRLVTICASAPLLVFVAAGLSMTMASHGWSEDPFEPFTNTDRSEDSELTGVAAPKSKVRREGTLVPPTVGRIVVLGRRWAFVPVVPESDEEQLVVRPSRLPNGEWNHNRTVTNPLRSGAVREDLRGTAGSRTPAWNARLASERMMSDRPTSSSVINKMRQGKDAQLPAPLSIAMNELRDEDQTDLPRLLIVENLMLQRIVEAIRADAADDHWLISGELTEYFDENRLLIRVAQRASSK